MGQQDSDWLRNLEFISLLISVIGWPVFFLSGAVLSWYILLPKSTFPIVVYLLTITLLIFGISWDTRYNGGGIMFVRPFKNYLHHSETENDRSIGRFSFLSLICLIFLSYGILLTIISL